MDAGRDLLLSLIRNIPDPAAGQVIAVGVDDFALRRGRFYGTILIDMATHQAIDVLPDRESATLAAWLKQHPGIEVICRDRAGAYAEGARAGAPKAIQVADRWHLWHNLAECAEKTAKAHRDCLPEPPIKASEPEAEAATPLVEPTPVPPDWLLAGRVATYYPVIKQAVADGVTISAISRQLKLDRKTVRRYARADSPDELLTGRYERTRVFDDFREHLHRRWAEGCTNAAVLYTEIKQLGYAGSDKTVRRYLQQFRDGVVAPTAGPVPPKPREVACWLLTHPDRLDPEDAVTLKAILSRCPELHAAHRLVCGFAAMMDKLDGDTALPDWLDDAESCGLAAFASFATGIRRDLAAVTNGLSTPYSSGAVEGTVNRIKMLKRQMFGRAKFDLLRKRILLST